MNSLKFFFYSLGFLITMFFSSSVFSLSSDDLKKRELMNLEDIQSGVVNQVYFIRAFDGFWPVPLRFILNSKEVKYHSFRTFEPIQIDKTRSGFQTGSFKYSYFSSSEEYKISREKLIGKNAQKKSEYTTDDNLNVIVWQLEDDNFLVSIWNEREYIEYAGVPDGFWQLSIKAFETLGDKEDPLCFLNLMNC